ncbi:hypothetical protein SE17_17995, partial [Kouleothrix aurantiaca]
MTFLLATLALLMIVERAWKFGMVERFFRRPPPPPSPAALVSVLQPILSGDPDLPACLEHN